LVLGIFTAAAAVPAAAQTAAGTRIGVVNMQKVFGSMQEVTEVKAKLESDTKALKTQTDARQAELINLKQQRDNNLKPDTTQYDQATEELEEKSVKYEGDLKLQQANLARQQSRQLKEIFDKIESATAEVAKQKGLDVVMTQVNPEFPKNPQDLTPDNISQLIGSHNMLYVSPTIDITDTVTAVLDAKYKAAAAGK
jgi:Skp family chaperone for outer membrane proteins